MPWISASAGCGKTTLLIKRLLALLVSKAQNIICITFTNAAVNEMQNRLLDQLYKLSVMDQEQIRHYLTIFGMLIFVHCRDVTKNHIMESLSYNKL